MSSQHWQSISNGIDMGGLGGIFFHSLFIIFFASYVVSLWGENQPLRARSFAACLLCGLAGLILSTRAFYDAPVWSFETFVYPVGWFLSALLLGTVTVGMLIGHWYLIDTGQSLEPFIRIYKFFVAALVAQTVFLLTSLALLYLFGNPGTLAGLKLLWTEYVTLFMMRLLIGQLTPLSLSWMIWRTLLIPHTMAATGLFYMALLGVFVGEILGKQILALTRLPF
jgi:hypothetical protein